MKINQAKLNQEQRLKEICNSNGIDYASMISLIESARIKKLLKRNSYHQQKINEEIEKSIK